MADLGAIRQLESLHFGHCAPDRTIPGRRSARPGRHTDRDRLSRCIRCGDPHIGDSING